MATGNEPDRSGNRSGGDATPRSLSIVAAMSVRSSWPE